MKAKAPGGKVMHIKAVPNKAKKPAILLRESKRVKGRVVKTTLANLSSLSPETIENMKAALKGGVLIAAKSAPILTSSESTVPCGHIGAVLAPMKRLKLAELIEPSPCRERDIALGLVAARILDPEGRQAAPKVWNMSSLASELSIEDVGEKGALSAMDWLLERQGKI